MAISQLHPDLELYYTTTDEVMTRAYRTSKLDEIFLASGAHVAPESDIKFWTGAQALKPATLMTEV